MMLGVTYFWFGYLYFGKVHAEKLEISAFSIEVQERVDKAQKDWTEVKRQCEELYTNEK